MAACVREVAPLNRDDGLMSASHAHQTEEPVPTPSPLVPLHTPSELCLTRHTPSLHRGGVTM